MVVITTIYAALKAASGAFQKLSEKERLAALAQGQFLADASADLLELTEAYKRTGILEPYLVSKFIASINAGVVFTEIEDIKTQSKDAIALVTKSYNAARSGLPAQLAQDDVRKLEELAGELKGLSRIIRGVAEANKQSGGWFG